MYDLIGYGAMITDSVRTDAYASALRHVITPESVVLDIGTGTGLFALLACQLGARHVYAVEPGDVIALARDMARANGHAQRITFIQAMSERVELPEPADIIVADIRGALPLYRNSVRSLLDARRRLLAPGGTIIPARDRLMVTVVDAANLHAKHSQAWKTPVHGVDMSAARRFASNAWHSGRATAEQCLAAPACWGELDYATLESPNLKGDAGFTAARSGTAHGLSVWFDCELIPGVSYSNAPDEPELVYGSAFFPLPEPVAVSAGDRMEVALRADLVAEDYTWSWHTSVYGRDASAAPKADFKQSSFFSSPISQAELHKRAASHRPVLNEDGAIALLVLQLMNEQQPLEAIARQVCEGFPERFRDWQAALGHVGAFSSEYSAAPAGSETAAEFISSNSRRQRFDG